MRFRVKVRTTRECVFDVENKDIEAGKARALSIGRAINCEDFDIRDTTVTLEEAKVLAIYPADQSLIEVDLSKYDEDYEIPLIR